MVAGRRRHAPPLRLYVQAIYALISEVEAVVFLVTARPHATYFTIEGKSRADVLLPASFHDLKFPRQNVDDFC